MKIFKKILLLIVISITFYITINSANDKLSYISLGDGLSKGINYNNYEGKGYSDFISDYINKYNKLEMYTKDFTNEDERITDLIDNIEENISTTVNKKNITIQNAIKKSDIISISIGMNEILYKYSNNVNDGYMYSYIDECINDLNKLIKTIRKLNNKDIYLLGYYNTTKDKRLDKFIKYANNNLLEICSEYKLNYVNLYDIFKNNKHLIYNLYNHYPNQDGYKLIANEIIKSLKISSQH